MFSVEQYFKSVAQTPQTYPQERSISRSNFLSVIGAVTIAAGVLVSGKVEAENRSELANVQKLELCADFVEERSGSETEPLLIKAGEIPIKAKEDCGLKTHSFATVSDYTLLRSAPFEIADPSTVTVKLGTANEVRALAKLELRDSSSKDLERVFGVAALIFFFSSLAGLGIYHTRDINLRSKHLGY